MRYLMCYAITGDHARNSGDRTHNRRDHVHNRGHHMPLSNTVNREFFVGKIFRRLTFRLVFFSAL